MSRAQFEVGDRVVYQGGTTSRKGKLATIMAVQGLRYTVEYDEGGIHATTGVSESSLRLAAPSVEDVNRALRVLRSAGKVEFVPNKPPFENICIHLNGTYTAVVSNKGVTIGCQNWDLLTMSTLIGELNTAVQSALAYNRAP